MQVNQISKTNICSSTNHSIPHKKNYSQPTFTAKTIPTTTKKGLMGRIGLGLISLGALLLKRPKESLLVEPSELEKELKKTQEKLADTKFKLDNTKNKLWKAQQELDTWEKLADNPMEIAKELTKQKAGNKKRPDSGRYRPDPGWAVPESPISYKEAYELHNATASGRNKPDKSSFDP